MVLDTIQGEPTRAVIKGRRNCAQQPVLQDPNAADAALVEVEPVIRHPAFCRTFERNSPQEFEERGLERNAICFPFQLVAGKMDRQATSPDLPIEFPKIEQIVGSHENVQDPGLTEGLQPLQLFLERTSLCPIAAHEQVMRFIQKDHTNPMSIQCCLCSLSEFWHIIGLSSATRHAPPFGGCCLDMNIHMHLLRVRLLS